MIPIDLAFTKEELSKFSKQDLIDHIVKLKSLN